MSYVVALIITLGILVTVHEWGHYIVARLCGVKVLRFSIGFGTPLFSRYNAQGTEFCIAPIPLGGYVKMLDEREVEVAEHEQHLSFNAQPLWQRAAIVAAGPLINLLFAALIFVFLFYKGLAYQPVVLSAPAVDTPAYHAGVTSQMALRAIDYKPVNDWQDVMYELAKFAGEAATVSVTVSAKSTQREQVLELAVRDLFVDPAIDPRAQLGMMPWYPAVIGQVMPDSAALEAGFESGDRILAVDGIAIDGWMQWVGMVRAHPERQLSVKVQRGADTKVLQITPKKRLENASAVGQAGVMLNTAAVQAEIQTQVHQLPLLSAVKQGLYEVKRSLSLQLSLLKKMIVGQISTKHLGGPVAIAQGAEQSIASGWQSFLQFLAGFSIMLGLMNLLPIPVLDGGHLMFMGFEALTGKPPSELWQGRLTVLGLAMLLSIMAFAIVNDVMRVL